MKKMEKWLQSHKNIHSFIHRKDGKDDISEMSMYQFTEIGWVEEVLCQLDIYTLSSSMIYPT